MVAERAPAALSACGRVRSEVRCPRSTVGAEAGAGRGRDGAHCGVPCDDNGRPDWVVRWGPVVSGDYEAMQACTPTYELVLSYKYKGCVF